MRSVNSLFIAAVMLAAVPATADDRSEYVQLALLQKSDVKDVEGLELGALCDSLAKQLRITITIDENAFRATAIPDLEQIRKYKVKKIEGKELTVRQQLSEVMKQIYGKCTVTQDGLAIYPDPKPRARAIE